MTPADILFNLIKGPKVYAYIRRHDTVFPSNSLEYVGETMLTVMNGCYTVCSVISPFLLLIAYNRSLLNGTNFIMLVKFTVTYYVIAISMRTAGRIFNPEYRRFADTLFEAHLHDRNAKALLQEYDYELFAAPIDFQARRQSRKYFKTPSRFTNAGNMLYITLRDCLSYNIIYTFARVLIYPGSAALLNKVIQSFLIENRQKLVVEKLIFSELSLSAIKGAIRGVLMTCEGNQVDTMFVDRREQGENGDILVITCEGNAGFYEAGIMPTPLALNYSVLGWNQPGFGESSGMPTPKQTIASIDVVIQYAIHKLGFAENQIVIYAWSIGGFPATWAAANYSNIRALILDATFDDLLPLAEAKMPTSWAPLVEFIIRTYFDMPIALQLASYHGPVTLIRRTHDEMIITAEGTNDERLASNRANNLLKSLLRARHSNLMNDDAELAVDIWLSATPLERISMVNACPLTSTMDSTESLTKQDQNILIYCLCSKYLIDFDSSHNTPLDLSLFTIPSSL
uniref:AB hydrolase-1 domain-containing protein n=1 Tax=Onchocerca volvulus TaxID=6282 RepID=A0A8R1Y234_ONCVO